MNTASVQTYSSMCVCVWMDYFIYSQANSYFRRDSSEKQSVTDSRTNICFSDITYYIYVMSVFKFSPSSRPMARQNTI